MKISSKITTDRLFLCDVSDEDCNELYSLINKNRLFLNYWLAWVNNIQNLEDEKIAINKMKYDWKVGKKFCYTIRLNSIIKKTIIGMISIIRVNEARTECEIGYWLGEEFTSKGYISEALQGLEKKLKELNFKETYIKCYNDNAKSISVAQRNGYKQYDCIKYGIANKEANSIILFKKVLV